MQQIIQGTVFNVLHDDTQSRRYSHSPNQQNDLRMSIFRKHWKLIIELSHELFIDVGVEHFFDSNFKSLILSSMDGTETAHGYLLKQLNVIKLKLENSIFRLRFRLYFCCGKLSELISLAMGTYGYFVFDLKNGLIPTYVSLVIFILQLFKILRFMLM